MIIHFTAALQKAQAMDMSAGQTEQLNDDVAKSGKIGASLGAAAAGLIAATTAAWATQRKKKEQQKRQKGEEGGGLTEALRRHQAKVEQRWQEEAERKRRDSHRGMDAKIERMEEAEGAAIAAAQDAKREAAEKKRKEEDLRAGLQALYEGRKAGESEASKPKPWWQGAEEKLTNGLIALAQKSPIARQTLLHLSNAWFHYGQPVVNAAADFIGGFATQTVQNNLDALAMLAPMPLQVRQNYNTGWENIHSGRSGWYQAGRFVAGLVGIAQGIWEMGSGVATATGGTVVSCGTVVLCFAGGGAAVAAGGAVAAHGALVTSASLINTVRSGRALFASAKSVATSSNARKLERNVEQATGQTKPAGYDTHHIVPSTHRDMQEVRQILKNWGIDINSPENGVFLPKEIHRGLANDHTYMRAVTEDLQRATSREDAIRILRDIGEQLLDDTYPRSGR